MLEFKKITYDEDAPDMTNLYGAEDLLFTYVISGPHDYRKSRFFVTAREKCDWFPAQNLHTIGVFDTLNDAVDACILWSERRMN